jgi:nucleotide-binding universal stress UspA family protein
MRLKDILFPVDFSNPCASIAATVATTAELFGSRLTLLHATAIPAFPELLFPAQPAFRNELKAASAKRMESFAARHFPSLPVKQVVKEGDPAEIITDYAHKNHIDLIMMPTHGYGLFRRFLVGSVTAKVLHDARCPVWTSAHVIRPGRRVAGERRSILCAVDCDSAAVPVIRWAGWLARHYQATFKIVHVIPAMNEKSKNPGETSLRKHFTERATAEFAVLLDQAGFEGELLLRGGNIPAKIAETARQHHSDLVVIGRGHTRKTLGRLRTNSLAIVREVPCPALSV